MRILNFFAPPAAMTSWTFVLAALLSLLSPSAAAAAEQQPPTGTINISFNMAAHSMTGTARITLPPATPLALQCGPLHVTGIVLEIEGKTPLLLKPAEDRIIRIAAAAGQQTLYVSWSLTAKGIPGSDNLIGNQGITLAGFWHPLPDRDMLYSLRARLPEGFSGMTEATTLSLDRTGRNSILTASFDHPLRAIQFAAGPYTVRSRTLPGGIILSTYFFPEDDELSPGYLDQAAAFIRRYSRLIGPYPYQRFSIVENRLPTGYGMPTFTLLGQVVVRLPFIKDTSLGHEILHSWFGNGVRVSDSGGNWCEGLTTYLADQMYAEDHKEGAEYRKNQLLRYQSYVHAGNTMALEDFANASDSQPMAREVRAIGYDKGSMVFHMLRLKLGDRTFYRGLRNFYERLKFKEAGWQDLEASFETASKSDLSGFFTQWLTRKDVPELTAGNIDISQKDGKSVISFTLKQGTVQPYDLAVPVRVTTRAGTTKKIIPINKLATKAEITVADLPLELVIDPDYDLMRTLDEEELAPTWSQFIGARKKTVVLAAADQQEIYAPLLADLERQGCKTVTSKDLKNSALGQGSYLFLGTSPQSLGLFANPGHPHTGFTVDVRRNPLNIKQIMVLVTSASRQETARAGYKLRHYGKYSFLHFKNGRLEEKRVAKSTQGIHYTLMPEPDGVYVPDIRSFDRIMAQLEKSRVIYVGEEHTDYGCHLLQLRIIQALFQADPNLAIGMEMFPRSSRKALDGYINGTIKSEREFLRKSRYFSVWGYDYRLYRPIIGYARLHKIPIIGLNLDKKIVSQIFRRGNMDGLSEKQLKAIAPERNLDIPGYRQRLARVFSAHDLTGFSKKHFGGFIQAQSIWDETMAQTIADYLIAHPGRKMVVIAGTGHVYKDSAIPPRVARRLPVPVRQSVVAGIGFGDNGLVTGRQLDYLMQTMNISLKPAAKIGVFLQVEKNKNKPGTTMVRVVKISPHGKAGQAGLKENDIIQSIDGQRIQTVSDLKIELLDKAPGDVVTLKVLRKNMLLPDEELELKVELSSMSQAFMMPPNHPK